MKSRLVDSNADRISGIEGGATTVIGVNRYLEGEPSPLTSGPEAIMVADPRAEADQVARLQDWRERRDEARVRTALDDLRRAARDGTNIMPASIAAAKAGATTGEWGDMVRVAFGQYRGPTGVSAAASNRVRDLDDLRARVDEVSARLGRRLTLMVGKPGLDGHSNGAEQIAARARDCGMAISYDGIRFTPAEILDRVAERKPHVLGLSILSGSHVSLVADLMERLRAAGLSDLPVVVGGIIPEADAELLRAQGVARIYTPKDFEMNRIMSDIVALADPAAVAAE